MNGVQARVVRERLNNAFELIGRADVAKYKKITELWAILSDIQLWMEDVETKLAAKGELNNASR